MLTERIRHWLTVSPKHRLPVDEFPLSGPGEGVYDQLLDSMFSLAIIIGILVTIPILLFGLAVVTWIRQNWITALIGLGIQLIIYIPVVVFLVWLGKKYVVALRSSYLGFLAEKLIGQRLEDCRAFQCAVFHNLVGEKKTCNSDWSQDSFNIDHLVIGPTGIFVVETKGKSKAKGMGVKIDFDGEYLEFENRYRTSKPVREVRANAEWVDQLLNRLIAEKKNPVCQFSASRPLPIIPTIVYPGWFIPLDGNPLPIRLTNDKMIVPMIRKASNVLTLEEVTELRTLVTSYLMVQRR